ncbi:carbohydrate ABC transporter permease [Alicyclobacillus dauci]|uniref:Sugar ABC transporter permease n=1 Tax=Alicyclobacillus dauci TaxID=1475485 RepID=A0ABY6YY29_9BACL|nr:sugar ABC transporter permease [Alicyclobacillus dauci]WAH35188.1 sugar ABC transporter permease [Alicyclobacillus dauci]
MNLEREAYQQRGVQGLLKWNSRSSLYSSDMTVAWTMMLPALLFSILMIGFPILYTLYVSFFQWHIGAGSSVFVGLHNYEQMLGSSTFWKSTRITMEIFILSMLFEVVLGIYCGIVFGRDGRGMGMLRGLLFIPSIVPPVAVGMIWVQLFDPSLGFVDYFLSLFGVKSVLWLSNPHVVVLSLAIVDIWEWTPFIAIIVAGGMQSMSEEPFESALIDGATPWQTLRYITLPLLRPIIFVAVMLRAVDLLRIFDSIYIMTQGGPNNSSLSLNVYSYLEAFQYSNLGYASALMLGLLVLVFAVMALLNAVKGRYAQ